MPRAQLFTLGSPINSLARPHSRLSCRNSEAMIPCENLLLHHVSLKRQCWSIIRLIAGLIWPVQEDGGASGLPNTSPSNNAQFQCSVHRDTETSMHCASRYFNALCCIEILKRRSSRKISAVDTVQSPNQFLCSHGVLACSVLCRQLKLDHSRLKYTEVQSQQMAFTQSPSVSNNPKIPT